MEKIEQMICKLIDCLNNLANSMFEKMHNIADKSNTTPDGTLRSYTLLENNIQEFLHLIQENKKEA